MTIANHASPDEMIAEQLAILSTFAEKLRGSRWIAAATIDAFADVDGLTAYPSLAIDGSSNVTAYVDNVAAIAEARRQLAARGIRLREGGKVTEYPESNMQLHELTAEGGGRVAVSFYLTANAGAKRCEYVKVGEKTVTQPVYELRCSEAAAPAEPADLTPAF